MTIPLNVLILEDRSSDADLIVLALRRAGYEPLGERVMTEEAYLARLNPDLEIILADYLLPQFDALRALHHLKESKLDIPFIVITGSISEEAAVECIKQGAMDYLLKDRLTRLGQAVARALEQKKLLVEKRRAESALRESEERYRSLFSESKDAIYISAREGAIVDVNQAALDLFGFTREEMMGSDIRNIYVNATDRERFQRKIEQMGSVRDYEIKFRKNDGAEMDCFLTSTVRRSDDGCVLGYQGIIHDVTERKRLEEQLRQAHRMEAVGKLAGGIAIEFNNLLTAILGNLSLASSCLSIDEAGRESITGAENAALRAAELVKQLMGFSRRNALNLEPIDLNAFLAGMVEVLHRLDPHIEIDVQAAPNLWQVEADPVQIHKVLTNLCVNARDAMPGGGRIRLQTENVRTNEDYFRTHLQARLGEFVLLSVSDTGHGVPPEIRARIFEPFFTTKESGNGAGLGLALVYSVVEQHRGWVDCSSQVNVGTRFDIYLPRYSIGSSGHDAYGSRPSS